MLWGHQLDPPERRHGRGLEGQCFAKGNVYRIDCTEKKKWNTKTKEICI